MDDINTHVMNLANSIIGVSILAMPYCFHECGIILSILMLLTSSVISRLACHFLLKSAIISRRKTFEYLAFHIFGSLGKLAIEIGIIGFLLGTCIAFFVVMGDLGPAVISEITGATISSTMRTSILMALALFGVLPLGLLRNVDSLTGVSQATIGFYCCLVLKVIFEATPHVLMGDWYQNINLWRPQGILQCLPIFSMALFCQTQLFEIYQAVPNASLEKMNHLVRVAVNICTSVYIFVGAFGYIAFSNTLASGNILLNFEPSFITYFMKIGYIVSVAFSFPLVIFPCRASMYSLLYKEGYSVHEGVSTYIPEGKFKALSMFIVFSSLIVGILIPNIELVLGLIGSTIGVMICVLFPVTCFICISPKNTNERLIAQFMLMIGIFVMVLGTYENLHRVDEFEPSIITINTKIMQKQNINAHTIVNIVKNPTTIQLPTESNKDIKLVQKVTEMTNVKEIRHEPPQPVEISEDTNENKKDLKEDVAANSKDQKKIADTETMNVKLSNQTRNEEVDIEAIKKEEKEAEIQEKENFKENNNQILIDTIRQQNEVQKEIVEQQKKLMEVIESQKIQHDSHKVDKVKEEKLKAVKEIQNIALKAIEKISEQEENGSNNDKLLTSSNDNVKKLPAKQNKDSLKTNHTDEPKPLLIKNISQTKTENINVEHYPLPPKVNQSILKELPDAKERNNLDMTKELKNDHITFNASFAKKANNTAPLFLKLGTVNLEKHKKDPSKLVPLPVVVLDSIKNKKDNLPPPNFTEIQLNEKKSNNPEIQAMRREILEFVSN